MKCIDEYHLPTKLSDLTEEQKQKVLNWIDEKIEKKKYICYRRTAYGLKHRLKHDVGVYVTTGVFRDAMVAKGFRVKKISKEDYCFNISKYLRGE